jgi:ribosome maturation factor RimP
MSLPNEIASRIEAIRSEVERDGVELLEVQFRRTGSRGVLTFIVDKSPGVTLDECADVNRRLGEFLDRESELDADFLKGTYFLEVNSPGLDRPLKSSRDFERVLGDSVRVAWKTTSGAGLVSVGRLAQVDDQGVTLEPKLGEDVRILFESMTKATLEIKI